jgi:hypothetical protein
LAGNFITAVQRIVETVKKHTQIIVYLTIIITGIVSIAAKFKDWDAQGNLMSLLMTLNPIMGHLSVVHAASAGQDLLMAVRYEFNTFSFDSDIAFGLHYAPEDKRQAIKLRCGMRQVQIGNFKCNISYT